MFTFSSLPSPHPPSRLGGTTTPRAVRTPPKSWLLWPCLRYRGAAFGPLLPPRTRWSCARRGIPALRGKWDGVSHPWDAEQLKDYQALQKKGDPGVTAPVAAWSLLNERLTGLVGTPIRGTLAFFEMGCEGYGT